jgi:uncharacterized membrane protein|tara:strand:- start:6379 stop:6675 length:297 start_codon:yes stop_codon:yes gene_type:complete
MQNDTLEENKKDALTTTLIDLIDKSKDIDKSSPINEKLDFSMSAMAIAKEMTELEGKCDTDDDLAKIVDMDRLKAEVNDGAIFLALVTFVMMNLQKIQ